MASKAKDSEGLGLLMDGVHSLVESLPPLVRALDVVAQIHPFLSSTSRSLAFAQRPKPH